SDGTEFFPSSSEARRDEKERLWVAVLASGARHAGSAYAISEGKLLELRLDADMELHSGPTSVQPSAKCVTTVGTGGGRREPLFLCQGDRFQTFTLARRDSGPTGHAAESVQLVWEKPGRGGLLSYGDGAALVSGPCSGRRGSPQSACHVSHDGVKDVVLPSAFLTRRTPSALSVTESEAWA